MKHSLPKLPYEFDALEPHIDSQTMQIHYTKHHQAYIDKLNEALDGQGTLQEQTVEDLLSSIDEVPEEIRQAVINHGGGHANHSLFWKIMSPDGDEMSEKLKKVIQDTFKSIEDFKEQFTQKALGIFGSGWAWLIVTANGDLEIKRKSFQNSPIMEGNIPILGIDVWEHAYYLKFQNRRADYIEAWWNVVNWKEVSKLYDEAQS
jgi:Fe-Mn family superoxide dismutase